MRIRRSLTFIVLSSSFFIACGTDQAIVENPPFFSMSTYIDQEIERLESAGTHLEKSITFNGAEESQTLEDVNYERELEMFRQADINRPAWLDKYEVDSIMGDGQLQAILYRALDETLRIQELRIEHGVNQSIQRIQVNSRSNTVLSDSEQELIYAPEEGYEIHSKQENRTSEPVAITIKAIFL